MFKTDVRPMEKAVSISLLAMAGLLFAITLISPNHGWVTAPGKAVQAAAEARTLMDVALIASTP